MMNQFSAYWEKLHPTPPPPPDVSFGVLPNIVFPVKPQPQLTFTAELPTGQLPSYGDRANVYPVITQESQILALNRAKKIAAQMGFEDEPQERSPELYRFTKQTPYPATLDMYIYTGTANMSTNWASDPAFFSGGKLPSEAQAIDLTRSYLKQIGLSEPEIEKGEAAVSYLKASNGAFLETISLSEADFIQVDLFREKIEDKYQGYAPNPKQGVVRTIISGNPKASVVNLDYYFFPLETDKLGVYPIKNPSVAWEDLIGGKGYVAQIDANVTNAIVRRLELGYYEAFTPQPYYQPIYIFKGDNNFVGYVEAVSPPTKSPTLTPVPQD